MKRWLAPLAFVSILHCGSGSASSDPAPTFDAGLGAPGSTKGSPGAACGTPGSTSMSSADEKSCAPNSHSGCYTCARVEDAGEGTPGLCVFGCQIGSKDCPDGQVCAPAEVTLTGGGVSFGCRGSALSNYGHCTTNNGTLPGAPRCTITLSGGMSGTYPCEAVARYGSELTIRGSSVPPSGESSPTFEAAWSMRETTLKVGEVSGEFGINSRASGSVRTKGGGWGSMTTTGTKRAGRFTYRITTLGGEQHDFLPGRPARSTRRWSR